LDHQRWDGCVQCPLVYLGLSAAPYAAVAPVRAAYRPVPVRLQVITGPAVQHVTAARLPADGKGRTQVVGRVRPPATARGDDRAHTVEIFLTDDRLTRH